MHFRVGRPRRTRPSRIGSTQRNRSGRHQVTIDEVAVHRMIGNAGGFEVVRMVSTATSTSYPVMA